MLCFTGWRENTVTLYRPIQSQLRLIASQLGPLSDAANRLTSPSAEKLHEPNAAA